MYRLFLALRYLWSRPISWISMVGIWLSVTALIATIAIMSGFLRDTRSMIRGTTADIIVTPRATYLGAEMERPPPSFEVISAEIGDVDGLAHLSPHLLRPALVRVPDVAPDQITGNRRYWEMNFVEVVGLDPSLEKGATDFDSYVRTESEVGDPPDDPDNPFQIDPRLIPARYRNLDLPVVLVGEKLFEFYRLKKGAVITLVTMPDEVATDDLKPLSQRFVVGGSFKTRHFQHDQTTVFIDLEAAREFSETDWDASEICLAAGPGVELEGLKARVVDRLKERGLNAEVETWEDRHSTFLGAVENERSILGVLLFFFVAVACFNVFATLTIMVSDKTKDIGVLNAMGASSRGLLGIFVNCGMVMALASSVLGCVSGLLLARNINGINDLLEKIFGVRIFREDVYSFHDIPVEIEPRFVLAVFVITNVVAILCAILPALRAARMDPVRALRYE